MSSVIFQHSLQITHQSSTAIYFQQCLISWDSHISVWSCWRWQWGCPEECTSVCYATSALVVASLSWLDLRIKTSLGSSNTTPCLSPNAPQCLENTLKQLHSKGSHLYRHCNSCQYGGRVRPDRTFRIFSPLFGNMWKDLGCIIFPSGNTSRSGTSDILLHL